MWCDEDIAFISYNQWKKDIVKIMGNDEPPLISLL